jgi:hypothetical protein
MGWTPPHTLRWSQKIGQGFKVYSTGYPPDGGDVKSAGGGSPLIFRETTRPEIIR